MQYVYHYSGIYSKTFGGVVHVDGINASPLPVNSMQRYKELKEAIALKAEVDVEKLTITSLTFLHQKP